MNYLYNRAKKKSVCVCVIDSSGGWFVTPATDSQQLNMTDETLGGAVYFKCPPLSYLDCFCFFVFVFLIPK